MSDPTLREGASGDDPRGSGGLPARRTGAGRRLPWALILWTGVISAVVLPWASYQPHEHWARIIWVPFSTPPPLTARDIVVNVLLYVPFGFLYARWRSQGAGRAWSVLSASLLLALALSAATELTQVYSHGRFPSATDVTLNVAGACLGAALGRRRGHQ